MATLLLSLCAWIAPVTDEFPSQRPVTQSFDVFFDVRLNKRLDNQSWSRRFETPLRSFWRYRNAYMLGDCSRVLINISEWSALKDVRKIARQINTD